MKSYFTLTVLSALIIGCSSCKKIDGNGQVISEERPLSPFNKLNSSIDAEIIYIEGPEHEVEVIAESNMISYIETDIDDGILELKLDDDDSRLNPTKRIKFVVTSPGLSGVNTLGSADFYAEVISSPVFNAKITGSGNIRIATVKDMTRLNAFINGSGDIEVETGVISDQEIEITGSGNVNNSGLLTSATEISIMGSGNAHVYAEDLLKVHITGSGNVYYQGTPSMDINITGSGKVIKK